MSKIDSLIVLLRLWRRICVPFRSVANHLRKPDWLLASTLPLSAEYALAPVGIRAHALQAALAARGPGSIPTIDGTAACTKLGYARPQGEYIVVLENTCSLHNVFVCTLFRVLPG